VSEAIPFFFFHPWGENPRRGFSCLF